MLTKRNGCSPAWSGHGGQGRAGRDLGPTIQYYDTDHCIVRCRHLEARDPCRLVPGLPGRTEQANRHYGRTTKRQSRCQADTDKRSKAHAHAQAADVPGRGQTTELRAEAQAGEAGRKSPSWRAEAAAKPKRMRKPPTWRAGRWASRRVVGRGAGEASRKSPSWRANAAAVPSQPALLARSQRRPAAAASTATHANAQGGSVAPRDARTPPLEESSAALARQTLDAAPYHVPQRVLPTEGPGCVIRGNQVDPQLGESGSR